MLSALLVLGSKDAEERVDPVDLEIDAEAIDEDEAGDIGSMAMREDARVHLPERMPDDDERRRLPGDLQEAVQVVGRIGDRVLPAGVARPATGSVVGARARGGAIPSCTGVQPATPSPIPASSTIVGEPVPRQSRYSDRPPRSMRSPCPMTTGTTR